MSVASTHFNPFETTAETGKVGILVSSQFFDIFGSLPHHMKVGTYVKARHQAETVVERLSFLTNRAN